MRMYLVVWRQVEINRFSPLDLKKMKLKQFSIARLKENPLTIEV